MAFATTNVRSVNLGGNLKMTVGDWSGAVGDAAGSFQMSAGKIYLAEFLTNITTGAQTVEINVSPSGTAGIVTLTVYNGGTVTAGTFAVISA